MARSAIGSGPGLFVRSGLLGRELLVEPIGARGTEEVERERVLQRLNLVRGSGGDSDHLTVSDHDVAPRNTQPQHAFKHIDQLFALVSVKGHERTTFQIHLRHHLAATADQLARDELGDLVKIELIPGHRNRRCRSNGTDKLVSHLNTIS